MQQNILEVSNVSKSYHLSKHSQNELLYALKDISFEVARGTSLGIVGQNGSGKSTLLKIISGVVKPSQGTVKHFGSFSSILDLGSGIIPELTGRDNIYFIGKIAGLSKQEIKKNEEEIIDFSGLVQFIDEPVKNYSNGMYLRLAFSIQTALKPDLLILDEIINVGDLIFQDKCFNKIKDLRNNGGSLIIVTHNLNEIIKYSNSALLINKGILQSVGNSADIVSVFKKMMSSIKLNNNPKDFTGELNQSVDVTEAVISKSKIKMSEEITLNFKLVIKQEDIYDVMLYVSDHRGIILSDSPSYRENQLPKNYKEGLISFSCTLPKNYFNKGFFYVGLMVGNRKGHFFENLELCQFEVISDEWDKDNIWTREHDYFPLRPKLDWKYND